MWKCCTRHSIWIYAAKCVWHVRVRNVDDLYLQEGYYRTWLFVMMCCCCAALNTIGLTRVPVNWCNKWKLGALDKLAPRVSNWALIYQWVCMCPMNHAMRDSKHRRNDALESYSINSIDNYYTVHSSSYCYRLLSLIGSLRIVSAHTYVFRYIDVFRYVRLVQWTLTVGRVGA